MSDDLADDVELAIDKQGQIRRCGSLKLPSGFVSAFPPSESSKEIPLFDDNDIKKLISDPNRRRAEDVFPSEIWITNQQSHGSCNGFAGAGAYSRARKLRGLDDDFVGSGAYLYSLVNGHRDNGSMLEDGLRAIELHGVPPQELVPWDQIYPEQQSPAAKEIAKKHRGFRCYRAMTKQGWRSGLAAGFVGIAAVQAGRNFNQLTNGVCGVDRGFGNHAVCVTDFRLVRGSELYLIDNSWGTSGFGEGGRAWASWESFEQCFDFHAFYLIPSTEDLE